MKYYYLLFLLLACNSSIASSINGTKIEAILAGEVYGNVVFLKINPKPPTLPGCQTNTIFNYAFNPTTEVGTVTMSMVLTAYAAGSNVYLNGYDVCTTNSAGVEDLRQFQVQQ